MLTKKTSTIPTNSLLRELVHEMITEAKWSTLRTPEPNEPKTYHVQGYHTTIVDNWPSISKRGLIPGASKPAGQDWLGEYSGRAIYYHLTLPLHEIDSAISNKQLLTITIEVNFTIYSGYVVPDEEAGTPEETQHIIDEKGPIAVAFPIKPVNFVAIHLPNTPAAHQWAESNVKKLQVIYHD